MSTSCPATRTLVRGVGRPAARISSSNRRSASDRVSRGSSPASSALRSAGRRATYASSCSRLARFFSCASSISRWSATAGIEGETSAMVLAGVVIRRPSRVVRSASASTRRWTSTPGRAVTPVGTVTWTGPVLGARSSHRTAAVSSLMVERSPYSSSAAISAARGPATAPAWNTPSLRSISQPRATRRWIALLSSSSARSCLEATSPCCIRASFTIRASIRSTRRAPTARVLVLTSAARIASMRRAPKAREPDRLHAPLRRGA